ncbi:MAG: MdtA/MuxA family multidrug efflux RND transporter periplasmic adaptor subunit [Nitrospiraceae bacterium]|nr:MdtA/MuxA family multidrug efflux RND transporter periplasmic adaptor subunit [Nitrospiraceae bacterium]
MRHYTRKRHWWVWLIVLCGIGAGAYLYSGGAGRATKGRLGPGNASPVRSTPVMAAAAKKSNISIYLTGLGSVVPLNTVTVRSRVDGQLMKVAYREGQTVKKGDLLAEIDSRPFEAQLAQAQGLRERDAALLNNARVDLHRYQVLSEQDSIAKQQRDTQEALVRQYEGAVKTDQGQIDSAKLQIHYSRISAPLTGRVGLRLVDEGNIVHASDPGGLVVITQLQPISVIFSIAEDSLPQVVKRLRSGERLPVEVYDRDQKQKLAGGFLLTVDNQIDPNTGTVKMKAVFPNGNGELFPNQFVNARLLVEVKRESIVVPATAIQRGPQGTFVYVVKGDNTVSVRQVTIGEVHGGDAPVITGLAAGEQVVVDGAERLREGSRVELKGQDGAKRTKSGTR